MLLPLESVMFGAGVVAVLAVALAAGVALVEVEMSDWRRVPFTCSYMPGKRFVGLTMLIGFASFVAFTSIGSGLAYAAQRRPATALIVLPMLSAVVWQRRRRRASLTRHTPLLFEDTLPTEVEPLQLSAY
jgi:hypothetical protein